MFSPLLPLPSAAWWQGEVWWGGFVAAVSQSVCQGKSRLTFLTSSPHKEGGAGGNGGSNCNFMSISCSTNQGEQEACQPQVFLLLACSFLCFAFPFPFLD